MESKGFSDRDVKEIQLQYERQIRLAASIADWQARALQQQLEKKPAFRGVPGFPEEPDAWKSFKILLRYGDEAVRHLPDSTFIVGGIAKLLATEEGRKLLARLRDALFNHKTDEKLFADILQAIAGGNSGYGSLQLGVTTGAHFGEGINAVTGVAFPTKGGGKVKWFSGMERAKGLTFEAGVNLVISQKIEEPEHLTGQFYGYHFGIDVGPSISSNLYFDTSEDLHYKGFMLTIGVGFGAGAGPLWGFELVTSD